MEVRGGIEPPLMQRSRLQVFREETVIALKRCVLPAAAGRQGNGPKLEEGHRHQQGQRGLGCTPDAGGKQHWLAQSKFVERM